MELHSKAWGAALSRQPELTTHTLNRTVFGHPDAALCHNPVKPSPRMAAEQLIKVAVRPPMQRKVLRT